MATGSVSWGSQSETAQAIEGNDDLKPENLFIGGVGGVYLLAEPGTLAMFLLPVMTYALFYKKYVNLKNGGNLPQELVEI